MEHGKLAFDIGAHSGSATEIFAPHFDRVISCEPCDESYNLMARTLDQFPNVTAINCAISDHSGTMELAVQSGPISSGQLTNGNAIWGPVDGYRTLPCRTIDDLAREFGDPDFIKIDTEGHELLILNGGLETLSKTPALFVEVHEESQGDEIFTILTSIYGDQIKKRSHSGHPEGTFLHQNHYWLMTSGIAGSPIDVPFLFSRRLSPSKLQPSQSR